MPAPAPYTAGRGEDVRKGQRGMRGSTIVGVGCFLPERVVSSDEVAQTLGVPPEWVLTRTGIRTRHLAAPGETVVDLATHAANAAILHSGQHGGEHGSEHGGDPATPIDAVIVATSTGDRMPSAASQVAARLGLHCAAFDINAACAGFCHALAVGDGLIRTGGADTVLIVGVDISSTSIDWTDRNTAPIFGDGAGAVVLRHSDTEGIGPTMWGSQGEFGGLVTLTGEFIQQQGPSVFRWAIGLGDHVRSICHKGGVEPADMAAFVPHQANLRIIDALVADLQPSDAVIARDVVDVGNTMAASIPIALARMAQRRELPIGGPIVLFGFGSGLSYAGQTIRLSHDLNRAR
jgi:3-oxoacyl-[acyl-carrier-protein] synthase-3